MKTRARSLISRIEAALARETSSRSFIPEIDGLRFIAITLVVLYHATYWLAPQAPRVYRAVVSHGNFGVQLFFVISGFILAVPFAKQHLQIDGDRTGRVDLRRYFLRRLTRLEPPYIINLFLWFWIKVLLLHKPLRALLPHVAASVFYSHNWIYGAPSEINFYAWSLEVEVQFYLLAPLLSIIFVIRSREIRHAVFVAIILVLSVQRLTLTEGERAFQYLTFFGQAEWFITGLVLADIYLIEWKQKPKRSEAWNLLGVISWPAIFVTLSMRDERSLAASLLTVALPWLVLVSYVAVFRAPLLNRFARLRPIYTVGGMCYSIYLYHGYVVVAVMRAQQRFFTTNVFAIDTVIGLLAIAAAVCALCGTAFVLFEKPFMRPSWPADWRLRTARAFRGPRAY
jgi:peptidoglycan/LPS O-acetylase OafA/YrhL